MSGLNLPIKNVAKTTKLFIDGEFPRTESGRAYPVIIPGGDKVFCHLCQASRKDIRGAVEAATAGQKKWSKATAYNRGQILYRMAEMLEGKRGEIVAILQTLQMTADPQRDVDQSIDALIFYAGFTDKFAQVMGSINPVSGPFHNFTTPEPVGVVAYVNEGAFSLPTFIGELAAVLCSGNAVVAILDQPGAALLSELGEICKTSDLPAGVVNLLSGKVAELLPTLGEHMEVQSLLYSGADVAHLADVKVMAIDNMKRVVHDLCKEPDLMSIVAFTEMKTVWHPVGL